MSADKIQLRGNCPCCGRQQARLKSGLMSKHGYVVDHGWFNGVCPGQNHAPMQIQRKVTDDIIAQVRSDVVKLEEHAQALKDGVVVPKTCRESSNIKAPEIPFDQGKEWMQRKAIESAIYVAESRARAGRSFANDLEALVNKVHGTPLIEVKIEEASAPIVGGEKRRYPDGAYVFVVKYQDGHRVYCTYEKNERVYETWIGTSAWRKMELAC